MWYNHLIVEPEDEREVELLCLVLEQEADEMYEDVIEVPYVEPREPDLVHLVILVSKGMILE